MKPEESFPGMAHFAGTGPKDEMCGTCKHFAGYKRRYGPRLSALIIPGRCRQYIRLMRAATGRRRVASLIVPVEAPACRYWSQR